LIPAPPLSAVTALHVLPSDSFPLLMCYKTLPLLFKVVGNFRFKPNPFFNGNAQRNSLPSSKHFPPFFNGFPRLFFPPNVVSRVNTRFLDRTPPMRSVSQEPSSPFELPSRVKNCGALFPGFSPFPLRMSFFPGTSFAPFWPPSVLKHELSTPVQSFCFFFFFFFFQFSVPSLRQRQEY